MSSEHTQPVKAEVAYDTNTPPSPPPSDPESAQPADDKTQHSLPDFPDGGRDAWLVAAGATCILFCTFGYSNTFGVFQAYYMFNQLPGLPADSIAWIGSIQAFLVFATSAVGGPLFDRYGAWIIRPAAVAYVFSLMMTSLCREYWQFMLAQGVLAGLSAGLTLSPALAAVPQWFNRKRGAAMGLTVAGSSLGGIIFPIMLSRLLLTTNIGFGWSVRITAFLMIPLLAFAAFAVRARLPPRDTNFFLASPFRQPMFLLLVGALFFALVGMYIPLFLLPTYAITRGMGESLSSYLVAIVNAASFFGRIIPGVLGDRLGRINTLAAATVSTAILAFCWPLAESSAGIIVYAAFFGFCSGAIVSGGSVAMTLCADKPSNIGTYMGVGISLASLSALVGPPVSGALVEDYGFKEVSYFGGVAGLVGSGLAVAAKWASPAGLFGRT